MGTPAAIDPTRIVAGLAGFEGRAAGSDAERRAAVWLQAQLRAAGREAELEPHWVRPHWALAHALHAGLGVIGSVIAVLAPVAGLAVLAVVALSAVLDVSGRAFGLRMLTGRRATQNVVSSPPGPPKPHRLVITAHYDAGRTGLVYRAGVRRALARLARLGANRLPGAPGWLAIALLALVAIAIARVLGAGGQALGAGQLVPTVGLIVAVALLLDIGLSDPGPAAGDDASGVAVALALAARLDAAPPRVLDVEVVLAGAGDGPALGLRRYLSARRRWPREATIVVHVAACGAGTPCWWATDGPLLALRLHPRLIELCAEVARQERHLGARPHRGHGSTGAHAARQARFPAVAIGCLDGDDLAPRSHDPSDTAQRIDRRALDATVELGLALVDELDRDLARPRPAPAPGPNGSTAALVAGALRRQSRRASSTK